MKEREHRHLSIPKRTECRFHYGGYHGYHQEPHLRWERTIYPSFSTASRSNEVLHFLNDSSLQGSLQWKSPARLNGIRGMGIRLSASCSQILMCIRSAWRVCLRSLFLRYNLKILATNYDMYLWGKSYSSKQCSNTSWVSYSST